MSKNFNEQMIEKYWARKLKLVESLSLDLCRMWLDDYQQINKAPTKFQKDMIKALQKRIKELG